MSNSRTSLTSELMGAIGIAPPIRTVPEGLMTLPAESALTTSSGAIRYDRRRSGSSRTTTVRALPPNGGGAETPGSAANIGRTLNNAWS